jgi:hypothetical protein
MRLDTKKILQRAFLAFTTGLFLACAASVSSVQGATLPSTASTPALR